MNTKFYLVFHDAHLRQRIFYHARPQESCSSVSRACYLNYPEAIEYAPYKMRPEPQCIVRAAESGNLELVKWCWKNRGEDDGATPEALCAAIRTRHCEVAKWIHENCPGSCTTETMWTAIGNGLLDLMKCLYDNCRGGKCPYDVLAPAAMFSRYWFVQWLVEERGVRVTRRDIEWAKESLYDETAEYLEEHWHGDDEPF